MYDATTASSTIFVRKCWHDQQQKWKLKNQHLTSINANNNKYKKCVKKSYAMHIVESIFITAAVVSIFSL